MRLYVRGPAPVRFATRVEKIVSGCWQWHGPVARDGYGRFSIASGVVVSAHRFAYEQAHGAIEYGLTIDHVCRNRACVNPAHLEAVTHAENMRRSAAATKTSCVNGHGFTSENTYIRPGGGRDCRTCIRDRVRRYRERNAA